MNVILSIRPRYVGPILSGVKRYEFRRAIFRDRSVEKVYIYSTSPVKRIVGYFLVRGIHADSPQGLWDAFHLHAGIGEEEFFRYFSGRSLGYALGIGDLTTFDEPLDPWTSLPGFRAPQNFSYMGLDLQPPR